MDFLLRFFYLTSVLSSKSIKCFVGSVNKPPYFIPGTGDLSSFSISENFQVNTSVYKLKGNHTALGIAV